MGGAAFPHCYLTWGQTKVEIMRMMATSFKRSPADTALLSAPPSPAAGHRRPTPLPETPGHSQASLGQSLVGSLLLSPGSWCSQVLSVPPRVCFPVPWKFRPLCAGLMATSSKTAHATPRAAAPRAPAPVAAHADPHLRRRHSHTAPGAHKVCLSPLSISGG